MNKILTKLTPVGALFLPVVAIATDLTTTTTNLQTVIQTATYIAYTLAFLAFFWGLAMLLFSKSEEQKKNATHTLIISIIVIFVMTSIWGLVKVLQGTIGANDNTVQDVQIPGIHFRGSTN